MFFTRAFFINRDFLIKQYFLNMIIMLFGVLTVDGLKCCLFDQSFLAQSFG